MSSIKLNPTFLPETTADRLILCNCCQNNEGVCPTMVIDSPEDLEFHGDISTAKCMLSEQLQKTLIAQVRASVSSIGFDFSKHV